MEDRHIVKSHNRSLLLYHIVCPSKYRREVFSKKVDLTLKKVVQIVKSITAIEIFKDHPEVKKKLWGGNFWTSGYYINTVGQYGNMDLIKRYVESQGRTYKQLQRNQLSLF